MVPDTPKRNSKRTLTPLLLIFCLAILASISFAGWEEYQDHQSNRGFEHAETSNYLNGSILYGSAALGDKYQALVADLNGNGDNEVIVTDATTLYILDESLVIIGEQNIADFNTQPSIFDDGSKKLIILGTPGLIHVYNFSTSNTLSNVINHTVGENFTFKCTNGNTATDQCYGVYNFNTTTDTIIRFNSTSVLRNNITDTNPLVDRVPALNVEQNDMMVYVCDPNGDNDYGMCVISLSSLALKVSFNNSGIMDDIADTSIAAGGNGQFISSPIIYPLDGGSHEIIFSYIDCTTGTDTNYHLTAWRSNGVVYNDKKVVLLDNRAACSAASQWSFPVIAKVNTTNDDFYVCGIAEGQPASWGSEDRGIFCFSDDLSHDIDAIVNPPTAGESGYDLAASDFNGNPFPQSNSDDELVMFDRVWNSTANGITTSLVSLSSFSTNIDRMSIADIDGNGQAEILFTNAGSLTVATSVFTNNPPVINNTQNFGGYGSDVNYNNPVCVGSTVTFSAQECGGTATCNYDNDDDDDIERIVSNCGQLSSGFAGTSFTSDLDNGTFDGSRPSFACVYNVTGVFSVRLFLQDDFNPTDLTQFNSQTIVANVINGTAGITCNLGSSISPGDTGGIAPSAQESQTNEAIDDTLGILFGTGGGSDKLKLIVGIALILGIIAAAYREGVSSAGGIAVVAGFATILVTFIGLITPAIFILGLALVIFVLFIGRSLTGGGAPNGGS